MKTSPIAALVVVAFAFSPSTEAAPPAQASKTTGTATVTGTTIQSPEVATKITTCLKDYVKALESIENALKSKKAVDALKAKCLSANLRKNWQKIVKVTDANPLLCAQDVMPSWTTDAAVVKVDTPLKTMRVNLGTGEETYCLDIGLTQSGPDWFIDSSKTCAK